MAGVIDKKLYNSLERKLGYTFKDKNNLKKALTHRSYGSGHNERLEFLGDSVLNFLVAEMTFRFFENMREGDLSRLRSTLVNQDSLSQIGVKLGIQNCIKMGEGEKKSQGHQKPSIIADSFEAIIGAVYLEGGVKSAKAVIEKLFKPLVLKRQSIHIEKDPKTTLQELLQAKRHSLPRYSIDDIAGAAHSQIFRVKCQIPELNIVASGEGSSRRAAEQKAAIMAIKIFEK